MTERVPDRGDEESALARLNRVLERRAHEAQLLANLVTKLRQAEGAEATTQALVEELARGLGVDRCHVLLASPTPGAFRVAAEYFRPGSAPVLGRDVSLCDPDIARLIAESVQVVVEDDGARPVSHPRPISALAGNRAFVLTALRTADEVFGVLTVAQTSSPRTWPEEELRLLQTLADHASVALERVRLADQLAADYQRLVEANARLVEATRLRNDLATTLLRDIRSPLSTVLMTLDMFELQTGDRASVAIPLRKSERRRLVEGAQESCAKIMALLNGLIDHSSTDSRGIDVVRRRCSAMQLVADAVEDVRGEAMEAGILVESRIDAELPLLEIDVEHTRQALLIYLRNAVRRTGVGGRVTIEVVTVCDGFGNGPSVVFSVLDEGPGLSPEALPYAFDPFYGNLWNEKAALPAVEPLDLAIVRRIAAAQGGNVSVKSREGSGSVFSMILPAG